MPSKKKKCKYCNKECSPKAIRCNSCARKGMLNPKYKEIKLTKKEIYKNQLKKYPWYNSYKGAKQRCNNPKNPNYPRYGGRGIKFELTKEEITLLWERYKGWLLKEHSIDRIDNNGNYTFANCRFIEKDINSRKDKYKSILQFDFNGNFIKEWESGTHVSKILKIDKSNLVKALKNNSKTAGGFKWVYKN